MSCLRCHVDVPTGVVAPGADPQSATTSPSTQAAKRRTEAAKTAEFIVPVLCVGNASLHDMQASRRGFAATRRHSQKRSRTASGGHAALEREFFASSVRLAPRTPRDNEKRGPRSEACHASVWLRFGAATLARRRALRERMPCSLFSTLSGRDSRAAAQIKLSLSRSH